MQWMVWWPRIILSGVIFSVLQRMWSRGCCYGPCYPYCRQCWSLLFTKMTRKKKNVSLNCIYGTFYLYCRLCWSFKGRKKKSPRKRMSIWIGCSWLKEKFRWGFPRLARGSRRMIAFNGTRHLYSLPFFCKESDCKGPEEYFLSAELHKRES